MDCDKNVPLVIYLAFYQIVEMHFVLVTAFLFDEDFAVDTAPNEEFAIVDDEYEKNIVPLFILFNVAKVVDMYTFLEALFSY